MQLFISKEETAGELLEQEGTVLGHVISTQIASSMESVSSGGSSVQMHLYDVDNILLGEGWDLTLPCLKKSGQKNPSVEVNGTAVFRGDKYIGALDDEQTQNFMFLMNVMQNGILLVGGNSDEKDMALLVRKSQVSLTPQISGEKINMKVGMKMECSFDEENSEKNHLLNLGAKKVESLAGSTLQKRIRELVRQVQTEFGSDIFGFGRKIYEEESEGMGEAETVVAGKIPHGFSRGRAGSHHHQRRIRAAERNFLMEHIVLSALLIGFFVVTDLLPLMRDKNNEKKAVWFSIPAYAVALLINILVGLGVQMQMDPPVAAFLDSLFQRKK